MLLTSSYLCPRTNSDLQLQHFNMDRFILSGETKSLGIKLAQDQQLMQLLEDLMVADRQLLALSLK